MTNLYGTNLNSGACDSGPQGEGRESPSNDICSVEESVRRYQAYPEYKCSGSKWLGNVPSHWRSTVLKRYLTVESGDMISSTEVEEDGAYPVVGGNGVRGFTERRNSKENTIIIGRVGAKCGCIHYLSEPFWATEHAFRVVPRQRYLDAFMTYYLEALNLNQYAIKTAQPLLNTEIVCGQPFVLPDSAEEQRTIAAFLDYETARIDGLIEKQQRLIELLKEKRQAVISHAVTKGLNPDAPMKDSGVEWLGQVPEHWEVCRLKHVKHTKANAFVDGPFGSNLKSEHFIDGGDVYVIESNFATTGNIASEKLKTITHKHFQTIQRSRAEGGDIIIAKIGARFGSCAILPSLDKPAVVSGNSLKLTVNPKKLLVEYASQLLQHSKREGAMDDGVNVTAQPALSLGALNNLAFLAPPLAEQQEIVEHLIGKLALFGSLIARTEKFIHLSEERRAALISAAVTGKIDLRGWKAPDAA